MRAFGLLGCAIVAVSIPLAASAADMPVKAPKYKPVVASQSSWTGAYGGLNVGYGSFNSNGRTGCVDPGGVTNGTFCQNIPTSALKAGGVIGGGQIGYNYQIGQWITGLELDYQAASIKDSTLVNGPFPFFGGGTFPATFTASQSMTSFGTVRGRLGYTIWDRTMAYVTGGLAVGRFDRSFVLNNFGFGTLTRADSTTRTGWTIGGGLEYEFAKKWSVKAEGLYYDLGSDRLYAPVTAGFQYSKLYEFHGSLARVGINYRL